MAEQDPYLLLWLEGPLQAWGYDSKFGRRDSLEFPTKSGLTGLLCCALGAGGSQTELLSSLAPMDLHILAYTPKDAQGKRRPEATMLNDFHMVGSGYDEKDPWETLMIPKTSDGKKPVGGGSKMTYRYYIQDKAFAALFQIPGHLADKLAHFLQNPVWDLYLGRKTCVPTELIYQGIYRTAGKAREEAFKLAGYKNYALQFEVLQGQHEGEVLTLNDIPLQFGTTKRYRDRQVTIQLAGSSYGQR